MTRCTIFQPVIDDPSNRNSMTWHCNSAVIVVILWVQTQRKIETTNLAQRDHGRRCGASARGLAHELEGFVETLGRAAGREAGVFPNVRVNVCVCVNV